ncbi:protein flp [Plakobranchus ocellatus]|uniref:Protein flp n=1 Tax=Plakobranchus ocellatus TaxID=259542 RepID=A0AAV3YDF0_9GAST|nr:protein flp [Plakobranchus ocellatus]
MMLLKVNNRIGAFLSFIIIGGHCVAEVKSAQFNADEVGSEIEKTLKCYNNPGLGVSIVKDGKVIFSRGFGVRNIETKEPVDENTIFGIASVSKSFAATLLIKLLYETTNLTVDSKVQELLGEKFKMMDEFRTKETTFADLMGHRMAIPSNNRIRFDSNLTRESLLERLPLLPSNDQFRVKFTYNNLFFGLVTYLAEYIGGGEAWESLLSKHLLQPLGMDRTVLATTADLYNLPNLATGYLEYKDNLYPVHPEFSKKWGLLAGSGAVMTSARDITKWMNFHLQEGKGDGGKTVMAAEHLEEVHKPRMLSSITRSVELRKPQFPVIASQDVYAQGLRRGYYRGYERLSHGGSTLGYKALMSLIPELQIGIFTALSGVDSDYKYRSSLHYFLLDSAMGYEQPWLNATTICSFPEPWRRKSPPSKHVKLDATLKPSLNLTHFEGTYYNEAYGYLHVNYNTSLSTLILTYGWGRWQLFYKPQSAASTHKFYGKGMDITALNLYPMYFYQGSHNGEDTIISLNATAFESKLPPIFTKAGLKNEPSGAPRRSDFAIFLLLLALVSTNLAITF